MAAILACDFTLSIYEDPEQAMEILEGAKTLVIPTTTNRERLFISAYSALFAGNLTTAAGFLRAVLSEHPTDMFALKRAQLFSFLAGKPQTMLQITLETLESNQNKPYFHGMLAFAYEQCNRFQV